MGFVIFIVFTMNAFVITFFGGYFIDLVTGADFVERLPGHDSEFATNEWETGNLYWFVNAFYVVCYAWPILGGLIWFQSHVKRGGNQSYSEYRF